MFRRTFSPPRATSAVACDDALVLERLKTENRRLLAVVGAVTATTLVVTVALVASADAAQEAPTGAAADPRAELAFERKGDIWSIRSDGTGLRNLTRTRAREYAPSWSPDGRRLAFVSYRDGDAEIYVADGDAAGPRRLTRSRGEDLSPAWSPDGRRIAFASNRSGEFEIHVINADGTGTRRLTHDSRPGYGSYSPTWSPGGSLIAFHSAARTPENTEIYTMRPDGTGVRRLTRTIGDVETLGDDSFPTWSPDGRRIVFTSNRRDGGALWAMRADGAGQRVLLNFRDSDDWTPEYSPDGRTIAFARLYADGRAEIWLVRADGKHARRLGTGFEPSWRPAR